MALLKVAVELGRQARDQTGVSLKTPVSGARVVVRSEAALRALEPLRGYVEAELQALAEGKPSGVPAQREAEVIAAWKAKQADAKGT